MHHVLPTLAQGLIECCKVRPDDAIDYLVSILSILVKLSVLVFIFFSVLLAIILFKCFNMLKILVLFFMLFLTI